MSTETHSAAAIDTTVIDIAELHRQDDPNCDCNSCMEEVDLASTIDWETAPPEILQAIFGTDDVKNSADAVTHFLSRRSGEDADDHA